MRTKSADARNAAKYILELNHLARKFIHLDAKLMENLNQEEFWDTKWLDDLRNTIKQGTKLLEPLSWYRAWRIDSLPWSDQYSNICLPTLIGYLNAMDELVMLYAVCRHYGRDFYNFQRHNAIVREHRITAIKRARAYLPDTNSELQQLEAAHHQIESAVKGVMSTYGAFEQLRSLGHELLSLIFGKEYRQNDLYEAFNCYLDESVLTKAANLRELLLPCHAVIANSYTERAMELIRVLAAGYDFNHSRCSYYGAIVQAQNDYYQALGKVEHEIQKTF